MLHESLKLDSSQFCLACGLCCNGMLHAYASIHPNEVEAVRTLGLEVVPRNGALGFKQPCRLYQSQRCSNYPCRPSACKDYRCALFEKYLAGELSLEKARHIIQRSRELFASIQHLLPPGYSFDQLRISLDLEWDSGRGIFGSDKLREENAAILLALSKLMRYLKRHF
jgi:hypothetical protein